MKAIILKHALSSEIIIRSIVGAIIAFFVSFIIGLFFVD